MRVLTVVLLAWPGFAFAQAAQEERLMKSVLGGLQLRSIEQNREYCGYVGYDEDGLLIVTPARRGRKGGCRPDDPYELSTVIASYYTHGAYSESYTSEIPSADDVEADEAEGIDGWVATPGGRLWFIDTQDMVVSMICDLGCLPSDPDFVPGDIGKIADSYTYDQLLVKLEE